MKEEKRVKLNVKMMPNGRATSQQRLKLMTLLGGEKKDNTMSIEWKWFGYGKSRKEQTKENKSLSIAVFFFPLFFNRAVSFASGSGSV